MEKILDIELSISERLFLKRICSHWKTTSSPLEFSGYSYSGSLPYLNGEEKSASRKLVIHDLVKIALIPSTESLPYYSNLNLPIAHTSVNVPLPQPDKHPICFNVIFTPTEKGMDACFIGEL